MKNWIKGFDDDEASNNEEVHEEKIRAKTVEILASFDEHNAYLKKSQTLQSTWKKYESAKRICLSNLKSSTLTEKF